MEVKQYVAQEVEKVCRKYIIEERVEELVEQTLSAIENNTDVLPDDELKALNIKEVTEYIDVLDDMIYMGF